MSQQYAVVYIALGTLESVYNTLQFNVVKTSEHSTWQKFHCLIPTLLCGWMSLAFDKEIQLELSLRGLRAEDHQLKLGKSRINAIGIMSYQGMEDVYLTEDNINGDIFVHFVGSCLLPILMPFNGVNTHSVVVMDNCSVHHVERVVEMINSVGALIRFVPPYSPDLNPIELAFSKVKSFIKANYLVVQSTSISRVVVSMAFNTVTWEDCSLHTTFRIHFLTLLTITMSY